MARGGLCHYVSNSKVVSSSYSVGEDRVLSSNYRFIIIGNFFSRNGCH